MNQNQINQNNNQSTNQSLKPKYIIIDTEATGLFFAKNGLIQVGSMILDKNLNIIDQYCQDIQPPQNKEINQEALDVNGFDLERIKKGISYQDFGNQFLEFMKKYFGDYKPIVVAQFWSFDYAFLNQVFYEVGLEEELSQLLGNDFVDTKSLVNFANLQADINNQPLPFPITSLSKRGGLKDILGLNSDNYQSHDALGDCLATRDVLLKLAHSSN